MAFNNSRISFPRLVRGIRRNAEQCLWRSATKCTCGVQAGVLSDQRSDPNCPACGGWGFVYAAAKPLLALVSGYDMRRNPLEFGIVQAGDLMLATLPRERVWISTQDLVLFPKFEDGQPSDGELVERGMEPSDALHWQVIRVQRVTTVDENGVVTEYLPNVDFTYTKYSRSLTWLTGHGPQPGTPYAVRYSPLYEYVAFEPPSPRYFRGTDVGQRVLLRNRQLMQPGLPNP